MPPRKPRDEHAENVELHALYQRLRRVQELPLPGAAKAVLISLARHGNWRTGAECYPAVSTIARDASVSARHAQRLLRYLLCRPGFPCLGDRQCPHWGLIDLEAFARPGRPATWRLNLDPTMLQLAMPEVGAATASTLRTLERRGCSVPGCKREHHAKGLCNPHYLRAWRHGDPEAAGRQAIFGSERGRGVGLGGGYVEDVPARGAQPAEPAWKKAAG